MREPSVPETMHPLAREILEGLQSCPESSGIVIGGGVALQHYCPYRSTVDLDGWWATGAEGHAEEAIARVMTDVGRRHGLALAIRRWRETTSFELAPPGQRKRFSFQISRRSMELEPPLESAWPPVKLETFVDNLGAKMSALVDRGAPRDILDVHQICRRGLATVEECWSLWSTKHPGVHPAEARIRVLHHLEALEARRPLGRISDGEARESARSVREWVRRSLCASEEDVRRDGD